MTEVVELDALSPDVEERISVPGGEIMSYGFGDRDPSKLIIAVNGGPGLPCDFMRDSHSFISKQGWFFVAYDQLGVGKSDNPQDPSLWTIDRYIEEIEAVRAHYGADKVHLIGQSWGGWQALEYASRYGERIASLILENTCADVSYFLLELGRLREKSDPALAEKMTAFEVKGDTGAPEYQELVMQFYSQHMCRTEGLPPPMLRSVQGMNHAIYGHMIGSSDFHYTGNLKGWSRLDVLPTMTAPTLVLVGEHDLITPNCAELMDHLLPNSKLVTLPGCSHSPFLEDLPAYQETVNSFLADRL